MFRFKGEAGSNGELEGKLYGFDNKRRLEADLRGEDGTNKSLLDARKGIINPRFRKRQYFQRKYNDYPLMLRHQ